MAKYPYQNITEYIETFQDESVKSRMHKLDALIRSVIPDCKEKLSWGMPTYYSDNTKGILVQFAGYKKHIGFYSSAETTEKFRDVLAGYPINEKNTLQIPHDMPVPDDIIRQMVLFRIEKSKK